MGVGKMARSWGGEGKGREKVTRRGQEKEEESCPQSEVRWETAQEVQWTACCGLASEAPWSPTVL